MNSGNKTPTNIDLDDLHNEAQNNTILTVSQAFQKYETFAPMDQQLSSYSNPPDNTPTHTITTNTRGNELQEIKQVCDNIEMNSGGKQILVTLHNQGNYNLPKSHLHIKMNPSILDTTLLSILPSSPQFTYELLLLNETYEEQKSKIPSFIRWTQSQHAKILITIPTRYSEELQNTIADYQMISTTRPFQKEFFTYSTT
jgi:hypothetical protein